MIVVTGATGQLGQLVIAELLQRIPADQVVAAVRHLENASALSVKGVTVRACDYDNAATLADAFEPGDHVLLISSNDFVNSVGQHTAVVKAAQASRVSHLAYTSLLNAEASRLIVAQAHRATEPVIRESGVPYTLLRNNLYSEHFAPFVRQALTTGIFASCTRDGRVASATRRDFAAAAAAVLTEPGHEGKTYELSGDVAWSNSDLTQALSVISGTDVRLHELSSDAQRQAIVPAGRDRACRRRSFTARIAPRVLDPSRAGLSHPLKARRVAAVLFAAPHHEVLAGMGDHTFRRQAVTVALRLVAERSAAAVPGPIPRRRSLAREQASVASHS